MKIKKKIVKHYETSYEKYPCLTICMPPNKNDGRSKWPFMTPYVHNGHTHGHTIQRIAAKSGKMRDKQDIKTIKKIEMAFFYARMLPPVFHFVQLL